MFLLSQLMDLHSWMTWSDIHIWLSNTTPRLRMDVDGKKFSVVKKETRLTEGTQLFQIVKRYSNTKFSFVLIQLKFVFNHLMLYVCPTTGELKKCTLVCLCLFSSGPVVHKAARFLLQCTLSLAIGLTTPQDFHPNAFLSFSTVRLHVVSGRPTFLLPSGAQVSAVIQWQLSSLLSTWPIHFQRLSFASSLMVFIFVVLRMSLFNIMYGYLTVRILLRHLNWKVSNFLLSQSFVLQHDITSAWNNLSLVRKVHICFSFMNEPIALRILLSMSSPPPSWLLIMAPR